MYTDTQVLDNMRPIGDLARKKLTLKNTVASILTQTSPHLLESQYVVVLNLEN